MPLKEWLKDELPESMPERLPEGFDEIGDIAVLRLPSELEPYGRVIAEVLCRHRKNIHTVLNRKTMIKGEKRIPGFEILHGDVMETEHREYGYRYRVDLSKVFFTGRLSYERQRIASLVEEREKVIVPFAGAGTFAVPAAGRGATVIAIDTNPQACRFCRENARINGVQENLHVICGDALNIPVKPDAGFDRAILPAPYGMDDIIHHISPMVKKEGMVHLYTFKKAHEIDLLKDEYMNLGYEVLHHRSCGNVAPAVSRYVFDLKKISL